MVGNTNIEVLWRTRKGNWRQLERELQWLLAKATENPEKYIPKLRKWAKNHEQNIVEIKVGNHNMNIREFVEIYISAIIKLEDTAAEIARSEGA